MKLYPKRRSFKLVCTTLITVCLFSCENQDEVKTSNAFPPHVEDAIKIAEFDFVDNFKHEMMCSELNMLPEWDSVRIAKNNADSLVLYFPIKTNEYNLKYKYYLFAVESKNRMRYCIVGLPLTVLEEPLTRKGEWDIDAGSLPEVVIKDYCYHKYPHICSNPYDPWFLNFLRMREWQDLYNNGYIVLVNADSRDQIKKETTKVEKEINAKLQRNCGFDNALNETNGLSRLTGGIVRNNNFTGGYNPSKKQIIMPTNWDGDVTSSAFLEELIHYLQDQIYSGGTGSKYNTAKTNIEFEAKVLVDLYRYGINGTLHNGEIMVLQRINGTFISKQEYLNFLTLIKSGRMTNDAYLGMLYKYNEHTPYSSYKNKIDKNLKPELLKKYGRSFLSNNCK